MKKFDALGRSLNRVEQKQIMGGVEDVGDCTDDKDCPDGPVTCTNNQQTVNGHGFCNKNTHKCQLAAIC